MVVYERTAKVSREGHLASGDGPGEAGDSLKLVAGEAESVSHYFQCRELKPKKKNGCSIRE